MQSLASLNGEILPLAEAKISVLDRGFLFGDAVYEVLRVYDGVPWLLDEHLDRLGRSLEAIRLVGIDLLRLRSRIRDLIAAGPFREATVYVQITRGVAYPRKHAFPRATTPLELLWVEEFDDPYVELRHRGASAITVADQRWDRCDIKSTNLLANVLAMQAAVDAGCVEALLVLPDGTLTEGTHTSCFGVLDGFLLTAPNSHEILPGITRGLILHLAAQAGIPVREHVLSRSDLGRVSELFLTGTTTEVMPLVRVDGRTIGAGCPGPVTRALQNAYTTAARRSPGLP
jgi:D-alanine transaminase